MTGVILFGGFIALMVLGIPVIRALACSAIAAFLYAGFASTSFLVPQQILEGVDASTLLAIPFFIMAGNLMNAAGVSDRIFAFASALVGRFRGGLAHVNVLASLIFSGASGSALADIAGLGTIEIKAMRQRGYNADFAAALTIASSMLGPLIPPSIGLIVYAYLSETSVARLFLATLLPGLLLAALMMANVAWLAKRQEMPREEPTSLPEIGKTAIHGIGALVSPAIILGAIFTGVTTATEAGVLACLWTLLLGFFYRSLSWHDIWKAARSTVTTTTFIMIIVGFSALVGWLVAIQALPQALADFTIANTDSKPVFIAILALSLLVIGCFIESVPAKIILVPMLLPVLDQFGVDRIQFGVLLTLALSIGIATPPMGVGLFIASKIADRPIENIARAILPLMLPLLFLLALIAYWPPLTLWLPGIAMD
ncbi:TRAP transporter large permease [uncultured Martelella sp.]|uniref:TRAP transporter large permease n=1 Tax=uncultured Martelella sp. TaxID=392331 RepID=UPI0029C81D6C|nr:TRAP transporter large permease [uncultured Martelella sp.]